jgi:hypothetical protein
MLSAFRLDQVVVRNVIVGRRRHYFGVVHHALLAVQH